MLVSARSHLALVSPVHFEQCDAPGYSAFQLTAARSTTALQQPVDKKVEEGADAGDSDALLVLKRLQNSAFRGQPLLPLLLSDPFFDFRGYASRTNKSSDRSDHRSLRYKQDQSFWKEVPALPSPSSVIIPKNLHTVRRLIGKQVCPRARTGSEILKEALSSCQLLSTGFQQLDDLLQGGLLTGEITEVFGPSAVGKTQLCHSVVAATVCMHFLNRSAATANDPQLVDTTRDGATVLYLDTKGDFMAGRLAKIVESRLKPHFPENTHVLTRHCLARVRRQLTPQVQHLTNALVQARQRIALAASRREQGQTPFGLTVVASRQNQPISTAVTATTEDWAFYSNLQLIVIDNITAPFAPFTAGFAAEATFHLVQVIAELKRLTADLHIAVFGVNNIRYSWSTNRGCLGDLWARVPHTTLRMYPVPAPAMRSGVVLMKSQRCKSTNGANAVTPSSSIIDFSEC
nr:unnamed protein product [Spirometra erinaceieuropaei]